MKTEYPKLEKEKDDIKIETSETSSQQSLLQNSQSFQQSIIPVQPAAISQEYIPSNTQPYSQQTTPTQLTYGQTYATYNQVPQVLSQPQEVSITMPQNISQPLPSALYGVNSSALPPAPNAPGQAQPVATGVMMVNTQNLATPVVNIHQTVRADATLPPSLIPLPATSSIPVQNPHPQMQTVIMSSVPMQIPPPTSQMISFNGVNNGQPLPNQQIQPAPQQIPQPPPTSMYVVPLQQQPPVMANIYSSPPPMPPAPPPPQANCTTGPYTVNYPPPPPPQQQSTSIVHSVSVPTSIIHPAMSQQPSVSAYSTQVNTNIGMYGPVPVHQQPPSDVGMYGPIPTPKTEMEEYDPAAPTDDIDGKIFRHFFFFKFSCRHCFFF